MRPDGRGCGICVQRDDGERDGKRGGVVQAKLVPAIGLVCAGQRGGRRAVLRGLPEYFPVGVRAVLDDDSSAGGGAHPGNWSNPRLGCASVDRFGCLAKEPLT